MKNTPNASPRYYPAFDFLRIISASIVVLTHDRVITFWPHSGNFAVQVFFALSGWLIGANLLRMGPTDLPKFYFGRAARIWAPYYFATLLIVGLSAALGEATNLKWVEFVYYKITFVYNIFGTPQLATHLGQMPLKGTANHFWSVNAEEQFYLLAPLLLVLSPAKWGRSLALWVIICLITWATDTYAAIVFGVAASLINDRFPGFHNRVAYKPLTATAIFVFSIALAAKADYALTAPLCAVSLVLFFSKRGQQNSAGKFLGAISYPLYLNHWIGVFLGNFIFKQFGMRDTWERQTFSFFANIAVAAFLYYLIDHAIQRRKEQFFSNRIGIFSIFAAYGLTTAGLIAGIILR